MLVAPATIDARPFELEVQRRDADAQLVRDRIQLEASQTAIVVVDMWDRHWCKTYTARVANLVPRMNRTLGAARSLGVQVVWAPSDVVAFYRDHPARRAMLAIPPHPAPAPGPFAPPPAPKGDNCECGPDRPCPNASVWTRQQAGLEIVAGDLIADCNEGQELLNLCAERGIETLIYMGVASNMCVCYRSCGMINLRRHGLRVLFVSDLVEAIMANGVNPVARTSDPNFTPAKGTALVQQFLEQHVAPSFASRQLLAAAGHGPAAHDRRPHVVYVLADDEYKTEQTLPEFARRELGEAYRSTFCVAQLDESSRRADVPGLEALYDADLLVLSMRRRALPVPQMDHLERYLRAGKPLIALRVSAAAFQVEPKDCPPGHVRWRDFDQEVLGCHYRGYDSKARETGSDIWVVPEARGHAMLRGLEEARFHSPAWIYYHRPLASTATVLMRGRWTAAGPEEPVAWTNTRAGGRVFYTTQGHWEDFRIPAFNRLLANAVRWTLGQAPAPGP